MHTRKKDDPPIWFPDAQQGLVVWSVAKEVCPGNGWGGRRSENPVQKRVHCAVSQVAVHLTMAEEHPEETATQEPMVAERGWKELPEDPEKVWYSQRTPPRDELKATLRPFAFTKWFLTRVRKVRGDTVAFRTYPGRIAKCRSGGRK